MSSIAPGYYRHLWAEPSPAKALRALQLELLESEDERLSAPNGWASLRVVVSDAQ